MSNKIFFILLGMALLASVSFSWTNLGGGDCTCASNCTDCNQALDSVSCTRVNLTSDITAGGTCISRFANKIFDCQGHLIDGPGYTGSSTYGVFIDTVGTGNNNVIKNCRIRDFQFSIFIIGLSAQNNYLINNTCFDNYGHGIYIDFRASNNFVINCTAYNNSGSSTAGIRVYDECHNTTLINNTVHDNNYGIYVGGSSAGEECNYPVLIGNTAHDNTYNGIYLRRSPYGIVLNNTAYDNDMGFVVSSLSHFAAISNNTAHDNTYGFYLSTSNSNATNNTAYNNAYGLYLYYFANGNFSDISSHNNSKYGLHISESGGATISDAHLYNNNGDICLNSTSSAQALTLTNFTFDNPAGNFQNYTTLALTDTVESGTAYIITWNSPHSPLPDEFDSFAQKSVDIISATGTQSITSIIFSWLPGELAGYNESEFHLYKWSGSWSDANDTPDTVNHEFSLYNVASLSNFAILEESPVENCPIISSSGTYTQSNNYTGAPNDASEVAADAYACVKITSSDVIFDCNGYSMTGNDTLGTTQYGVFMYDSLTNVTLKNCIVSNYDMGIYSYHSANGSFENNTVSDSSQYGVFLFGSDYNNLTGNTAYNNSQHGIYLQTGSDYNNLTDNTANGNLQYGIYLSSSSGNNLTANTANTNGGGTYAGIYLFSSSGNTLINNNAHNNTRRGIYLASSSGNTLINNTAKGHVMNGIHLSGSNSNTLINNTANDNPATGIYLAGSNSNNITNNNASGNSQNGIFLQMSTSNNLTNNTASGNTQNGILLVTSSSNTLINNSAFNSQRGIFIQTNSNFNNLTGNTAYGNSVYGIYISNSNGTIISGAHFHNNSLDFSMQTALAPYEVNLTNAIFDNPSGNLEDYTNLSLFDIAAALSTYSINWTSNSSALPGQAISFQNKYIDISKVAGSPSIDSISWTWLDSELPGYDESKFKLVKYSTGAWSQVPSQQLFAAQNALNVSGLVPSSIYGILSYTTNISVLKLNQTAQQPSPGGIVEFNITINNTGNISLDITAIDELPVGLIYFNAAPSPSSHIGQVLTWNMASFPAGTSTVIYLNATVDAGTVFPGNEIVNLTNYVNATGATTLAPDLFEEDYENVTIYYANVSVLKLNQTAQQPSPGGIVEFNITINNTGNVTLNPTEVIDTLPAGLSYSNAYPAPSDSSGPIVWNNVGPLAPGASTVIYLNATVDSWVVNETNEIVFLSNYVTAIGVPPNGDNVTALDTAGVYVYYANISVIKLDQTLQQPSPGGIVEFNLTITNTGNVTLSPVTIEDTLPLGLDYLYDTLGGTVSGQTVKWAIPAINPGVSQLIYLNATVNDSVVGCDLTVQNLVEVEGMPPNGDNVTASDTENVYLACANLSVLKLDQTAQQPSPGGIVEFNITINNTGNVTLNPVEVIDALPAGLSYYNADPAPDFQVGQSFVWNNVGPLAPGASTVIYLNATVDSWVVNETNEVVTVINYANATGVPPNGDNATAEHGAKVNLYYANVSLLKLDITPFPPSQGGIVQYSIAVTNTGNVTLNPLELNDTIPTWFTFSSTNTPGYILSGQQISWANLGPLAPGATLTILVNATVNSGTPSGIYLNMASVQGTPPNGDSVTALDSAFVGVNTSAINLVKTASAYSATIGDTINFTLNITNSGEVNLTVYVQDTLPSGVSFIDASPYPDSIVGQALYWNSIGLLQHGEFYVITYNASMDTGGSKENSALATGVPPNGANVTDSASVTISVPLPKKPDDDGHDHFECITNSDCDECYLCRGHECELLEGTCAQDSDCSPQGEGYYCDSCSCIPSECIEDSDCGPGFACQDYECIPPECWADEDCPAGEVCEEFECMQKPEEEPWPEEGPTEEVPVEPEVVPPLVPEVTEPAEEPGITLPLVEGSEPEYPETSIFEEFQAFFWLLLAILLAAIYFAYKRVRRKKAKERQ